MPKKKNKNLSGTIFNRKIKNYVISLQWIHVSGLKEILTDITAWPELPRSQICDAKEPGEKATNREACWSELFRETNKLILFDWATEKLKVWIPATSEWWSYLI